MKREEMDAIVAGATEAPWQRCVDELEDGRSLVCQGPRPDDSSHGAPIVWTSDGGANGIPVPIALTAQDCEAIAALRNHWPALRELWRACEERHSERRKGESIDAYVRRTSDRTSINAALRALEAVPRG